MFLCVLLYSFLLMYFFANAANEFPFQDNTVILYYIELYRYATSLEPCKFETLCHYDI